MQILTLVLIVWINIATSTELEAQTDVEPQAAKVPTIDRFSPNAMLKVPVTNLKRAKFSTIDIHGHFGIRLKGDSDRLQQYIATMDRNNIALTTSLDAVLGDEEAHLSFLKDYQERFLVFCHIDFRGNGDRSDPTTHACNQPGFVRDKCQQLKQASAKGIVGVKFFKQFGLGYRNRDGSLIKIDDERFDPIWKTCGELGLPVLIHTADPAAFFMPNDESNERYEELLRHPNWSFHGDQFPDRAELLNARNAVIKRHPNTRFIGAHMGNNPEDLGEVSQWLESLPNLFVELSSRIGELGRQPVTARKFFLKHQDRILFGTDGPWPEERLRYYWRFLETADEYFPYSEKRPHPQGLWFIYGINLPDEVLRKLYFENVLKLIPSAEKQYRLQNSK